jgi:hypothetical protein
MRSKDLLEMHRKHRGTLKEVTISNVTLLGSWHEVPLSIRDELCLDKLVLIHLFTVDEYEFRTGTVSAENEYSLNGRIEFDGQQKVISGIDEVFNKWTKRRVDPGYDPSWWNATDMGLVADADEWEVR